MFNWVCPRCGRENSPSYTECPDCKERDLKAQAEAEAQAPQPVPVEQAYQAPPQTQEWQIPYQPPQQMAPQPVQQPLYSPQQQPQYVQAPAQYIQPQYAPPQYAPPQQYAQPPQHLPPQQQPQYPPQQPQYQQPQPVYVQQPPQQYAPPQQQYAPPQQPQQYAQPATAPKPAPKPAYVPPSTPLAPEPPPPGLAARLSRLPTLVLMLLFAAIFLAVGAGIYYGYQRFGKGSATAAATPAAASTKAKVTNPIQKYVEVVGIRLMTDSKKRPIAKFVIVNHASTELMNLGANVTLWASTSRSEEDSVGSFTFNVEKIGPYETKEVSAPFKTKLKMYELPDWQNATPEIQITSPQP